MLNSFLKTLGSAQSAVTLLLTDDVGIQALNREHRGLDRATDILSWSYLPPGWVLDTPRSRSAPVAHLGELALSVETAARQAHDNGWDLLTESARLLAHGCAHLAGLDHKTPAEERQMLAVELRLLDAAGFPGLYPGTGNPHRARKRVRKASPAANPSRKPNPKTPRRIPDRPPRRNGTPPGSS